MLSGAAAALKGFEIMGSYDVGDGVPHGFLVQRFANEPGILAPDGSR